MTLAPLYVRLADTSEIFGISRWTIYRMAKEGHVRIYKRGGSAWVKVSEVSDYIENSAA